MFLDECSTRCRKQPGVAQKMNLKDLFRDRELVLRPAEEVFEFRAHAISFVFTSGGVDRDLPLSLSNGNPDVRTKALNIREYNRTGGTWVGNSTWSR